MKVGCTAHIPEIPAIHAMGFDFVELRGREVSALSGPEMDALEQQMDQLSLPCLSLNAYCPPGIVIAGPGFDLRRGRDYAEALARRAARLGVAVIGIGSPSSRRLPEGFDRRLAWEQARAFTSETAEAFAKYGIKTGFEALGFCYCNFINRVEEALKLSESLDHAHAGLTLDFYNMERAQEDSMALDRCAPHILHVHISDDLNGDPEKRAFLRADRFAVHRERLRRLVAVHYDGTLSLEVDIPSGPAAAESLAFLRGTIAEFHA